MFICGDNSNMKPGKDLKTSIVNNVYHSVNDSISSSVSDSFMNSGYYVVRYDNAVELSYRSVLSAVHRKVNEYRWKVNEIR